MRSSLPTTAIFALVGLVAALVRCGDVTQSRGYCTRTCTTTADCCPAAVPGCPGAYPESFSCEHGLCKAPVCQKDSDCTLPGLSGTFGCRAVDGHVGCLPLCASDADCTSSGLGAGTCTGMSDDGARICRVDLPRCTSDADCLGSNHCIDGACGCRDDADCPTGRHCQGGACGCATDAECGPNLDACTTDPAFAYPPSPASGQPSG